MVIGLTGGIGSGKTTVANLFAEWGIPIIDADDIARRITEPHEMAYEKIVSHFGKNILDSNQKINRKQLREIIFNNAVEKKWLEDLLHPLIRHAMHEKIKTISAPYCICVIPLLAESSDIDFINRVLVVHTPLQLQLSRAKNRDNATESDIQKIIASQANDATRLTIADDVIENTGDLVSLQQKVFALHRSYLQIKNPS